MSTELPELLLEGRDGEISSDNAGNIADGKDLRIKLGVFLEFKFVFRFSVIPLFLFNHGEVSSLINPIPIFLLINVILLQGWVRTFC